MPSQEIDTKRWMKLNGDEVRDDEVLDEDQVNDARDGHGTERKFEQERINLRVKRCKDLHVDDWFGLVRKAM